MQDFAQTYREKRRRTERAVLLICRREKSLLFSSGAVMVAMHWRLLHVRKSFSSNVAIPCFRPIMTRNLILSKKASSRLSQTSSPRNAKTASSSISQPPLLPSHQAIPIPSNHSSASPSHRSQKSRAITPILTSFPPRPPRNPTSTTPIPPTIISTLPSPTSFPAPQPLRPHTQS